MIEIAYEIMQEKKTVSFSTLYSAICKKLGINEEDGKKKMGNFYTQLSLDGRFVALQGGKWSLRDRLPFDKTHVDMSAVYNDIEESTEEDEEEEEEKSVSSDTNKEDPAI